MSKIVMWEVFKNGESLDIFSSKTEAQSFIQQRHPLLTVKLTQKGKNSSKLFFRGYTVVKETFNVKEVLNAAKITRS